MINNNDSHDVSRSDESFDTSRSNGETTLIGRNSLFQYSDDTSIQKYISQFHQDKADGTSNQEATKQLAIHDEDLSIKFNNLSEWKVPNDTDCGKSIVFILIKNISYRERLLDRINDLITLLDNCYWKYCLERMKLLQANDVEDKSNLIKLLSDQRLAVQRNSIFSLQNSLAVGISHLRSVSLEIIQAVMDLRVVIQKQFAVSEDTPSIFWRNQNYLIKMLTDVRFLFDCQSLRYWIGFVPNSLFIPPQLHKPFENWKAHIGTLMKQFLLNYKEKQSKDLRRTGKQTKRHVQNDKRPTGENIQSHGEMSSITSLKPVDFGDSSLYEHSTSTNSYVNTGALEEWEQLRDYCAFSWGKVPVESSEKPWPFINFSGGTIQYTSASETDDEDIGTEKNTVWVQSMEISPYFWNNGNQNPFVVEAALGLEEVFPKVYIVPPLPKDLLAKCLRLSAVLDSEVYNVRKKNRKIIRGFIQHKNGETNTQPKDLHQQLKFRQQGVSTNLRGISSQLKSTFPSLRGFPKGISDKTSCGIGDNFWSAVPYSKLEINQIKPFRLETVHPNGRAILKSLKKDSTTQQTRTSIHSRIDQKFFSFHASQIQRMIRGYLGRKCVFQLKQQLRWKIAVLKLQSLCRGFLARVKAHRRKRELRIVAFFARKGAIKVYRAAIVITHFIRDVANKNRIARGEVQLFHHKIDLRTNGASKRSLFANDDDTQLTPSVKPALSRSTTVISNFSDFSTDDRIIPGNSFEDGGSGTQEKLESIELPQSSVRTFRSTNIHLFSKNIPDSIRSCRLIPLQSSGNDSNPVNTKKPRKMLSTKTYTFLPSGTSCHGYSETFDVYIPPPCYERNFKNDRKKDSESTTQLSQKLKDEMEYQKLSSLLKASIVQ